MALTVVDGGLLSSTNAQYTGFKNRLINPQMVIDQRNAGASSVPATSSYTYTSLDRYFTSVNSPATSTAIQSTTVPTGFSYSLKIGRSGTGTAGLNTFGQVIETNNSQDLAGSSVTLSFWAKVGASATFSTMSANIYSGTVANQTASTLRSGWTGQATVATNGSVALTTTWQQFSITGSVGSTALQLAVQFVFTTVGTAGADDNLYITGVQLEKGSTATSFDYRPYGTELALCQRYCYAQNKLVTNTYYAFGHGHATAATTGQLGTPFPVSLRSNPSVTYSAANLFFVDSAISTSTGFTSITADQVGNNYGYSSFGGGTGATNGGGGRWLANGASAAYVIWSAEL